jgi:hypothetical protein
LRPPPPTPKQPATSASGRPILSHRPINLDALGHEGANRKASSSLRCEGPKWCRPAGGCQWVNRPVPRAGLSFWAYDNCSEDPVPRGRDASLVVTPANIHGRTGGRRCADLGPGHLQGVPRLGPRRRAWYSRKRGGASSHAVAYSYCARRYSPRAGKGGGHAGGDWPPPPTLKLCCAFAPGRRILPHGRVSGKLDALSFEPPLSSNRKWIDQL